MSLLGKEEFALYCRALLFLLISDYLGDVLILAQFLPQMSILCVQIYYFIHEFYWFLHVFVFSEVKCLFFFTVDVGG